MGNAATLLDALAQRAPDPHEARRRLRAADMDRRADQLESSSRATRPEAPLAKLATLTYRPSLLLLLALLIFNCNRLDAAVAPPSHRTRLQSGGGGGASATAPDGNNVAQQNRTPPTQTSETYSKWPENWAPSANWDGAAQPSPPPQPRASFEQRRRRIEPDAPLPQPAGGPQAGGAKASASDPSTPRRAFAEELIGLVMNNQLETIAERVRHVSERHLYAASLRAAELPLFRDAAQVGELAPDAAPEATPPRASSAGAGRVERRGSTQTEDEATLSAEEGDDAQPPPQDQTGAEPENQITCLPDYEDQNLIDLANVANLSLEQQQQLLADSSGLLQSNQTGGGQLNGSSSSPPRRLALASQSTICASQSAANKMIDTITKVIAPTLFGLIVVIGLLGNILVVLVILEDRKTERELTPTNLLILDLSLADLSFIIFCIPFTGWDYAVGHWVFGSLWCKFNQYLIVVCALSSIYTLVLMSIDRFMAIVYPIECMSYRTSRNMLHAIFVKWFLILFLALPTIQMHGLIESPLGAEQFTCRFLADYYNPLHFQIIFFITSYLFPLVLIFCLYLSLLNKLWFRTKPHGHRESVKMLESKKKVTWLVAGIVIVFALCWCPIQVMLILMRLKSHRITATYVAIQVFAHTLGYMNSCINPIVYAFASETFNQSFKRSWLGKLCAQLCSRLCCLSQTGAATQAGQLAATTSTAGAGGHKFSIAVSEAATLPSKWTPSGQRSNSHSLLDRNAHHQSNTDSPLDEQLLAHNCASPNRSGTGTGTGSAKGDVIELSGGDCVATTRLNGSPPPQLQPQAPVCRQQAAAKQQLVARINQSGNQVAHKCEPCGP